MTLHLSPVIRLPRMSVAQDACAAGERMVPEEMPVALTYNGSTHAVMMASPSDLEDFALGFSLSEGIVSDPADLSSMDIVEHDIGCEIRMWLSDRCGSAYRIRRRALAGPVGCGLCGVESLAEAIRPVNRVARLASVAAWRHQERHGRSVRGSTPEPGGASHSCRGFLASE